MTIDESHQLASWIGEAGKDLPSIVITQVTAITSSARVRVLAAFPSVRLLALNTTVIDEAPASSTRDPAELDGVVR